LRSFKIFVIYLINTRLRLYNSVAWYSIYSKSFVIVVTVTKVADLPFYELLNNTANSKHLDGLKFSFISHITIATQKY